jgi:predicted  nucleic acid-binding Zn-ribbon protein
MTMTAGALRELHRIHRQLTDLRGRLARGPKQIKAREANLAKLEAARQKVKGETKAVKMTADRKQLELKSGESKILSLQGKLNTCGSNKEYQALLDQIAAAEMANSVLSDEILEGLEEIDALEAKAGEAQKLVEEAQRDLDKFRGQVAEQSVGIETDIARLDAALKEAEQKLPADFRAEYDRLVRAKGEDALAEVEGEHCGGCHQNITPNQLNDLYLGRAVFCRACGRLLYLPEGQEPVGRE